MNENEISKTVIDCAIKIHKILGPGLLESVYRDVLAFELNKTGLSVEIEKDIPVIYKNLKFDKGFRADIIVENKVLLELKSVKKLQDIHYKQTLTYLRLIGFKLGLIINFNHILLKDGIKRIINGTI